MLRRGVAAARLVGRRASTGRTHLRRCSSSPPPEDQAKISRKPEDLSPEEQQELKELKQDFQRHLDEDLEDEEAHEFLFDRLQGPVPKLRSPPLEPPSSFLETWAPRGLVSSKEEENVLEFRTRYYVSSAAEQPPEAKKVVMTCRIVDLALTDAEQSRLIAVAGQRYNHSTGVLKLTCELHKEPHKNKAEIRRVLAKLLDDARSNAEVHSHTADTELPLNVRSSPWIAKSKRRLVPVRPYSPPADDIPAAFVAWREQRDASDSK